MSWKTGQFGAASIAVLLLAVFSSEAVLNPLTAPFDGGWHTLADAPDDVSGAPDPDSPEDDEESRITVPRGPLWSRPGVERRQLLLIKLAGLPPWDDTIAPLAAPRKPIAADPKRVGEKPQVVVDPNHRSHAPPSAVCV